MTTRKGALTFTERITSAYMYYVQGVDQHVIATAYSVNQGRVAEACKAIKQAAEPKPNGSSPDAPDPVYPPGLLRNGDAP